jgi:hypothetical protein
VPRHARQDQEPARQSIRGLANQQRGRARVAERRDGPVDRRLGRRPRRIRFAPVQPEDQRTRQLRWCAAQREREDARVVPAGNALGRPRILEMRSADALAQQIEQAPCDPGVVGILIRHLL